MPLVRPNFGDAGIEKQFVPGRYALKVVDAQESDKLDKNGCNALVIKFIVVDSKTAGMNGRKMSKWLPLGGAGAKVLFRFMKCVNSAYNGEPFTTESLIGKTIEADVLLEKNPKDGKDWAKVERVYPYLQPGSVGSTFAANATDEKDIPNFDDFDTN